MQDAGAPQRPGHAQRVARLGEAAPVLGDGVAHAAQAAGQAQPDLALDRAAAARRAPRPGRSSPSFSSGRLNERQDRRLDVDDRAGVGLGQPAAHQAAGRLVAAAVLALRSGGRQVQDRRHMGAREVAAEQRGAPPHQILAILGSLHEVTEEPRRHVALGQEVGELAVLAP